jgi:cytochrome b561
VAGQTSYYGGTAKVFHWLIVVLLAMQAPLGWIMENSGQSRAAGTLIHLHMSFGFTILAVIAMRFLWRLSHPVAAEPGLPRWQRRAAEGLHRLLYALVFAVTLTGWLTASSQGWSIALFWSIPLPHLVAETSAIGRVGGALHEPLVMLLLAVTAAHVAAALIHWLVVKDRVMQRMWPRS